MPRNRRWLVLMVALLGFAVTACGGNDAALEGQTWTLTGLGGSPAVSTAVSTLTFTGGTVNGNSGCNEFSGSYAVDGESMTIELGPATLRACEPAINEQETALFAALAATRRFEISGTDLRLLDDAETVLARYSSES